MRWGWLGINLRFGILQRYVMGEVFRAFALALLTITCVFVLLTVMSQGGEPGRPEPRLRSSSSSPT